MPRPAAATPASIHQVKHVWICQVCTRATLPTASEATDWLVAPLRANPDIDVVRCPQHWSEWALRISTAGRTNANRDRAREVATRDTATRIPLPPYTLPIGTGNPTDHR